MAGRGVSLTVDILVFHLVDEDLQLLTITRGHAPFRGRLALPGGFVEQGEDIEEAAARELAEETHVGGLRLLQVGAFGKPGRDPRGRVVSVAFLGFAPDDACRADDDAAAARFESVRELAGRQWSFDHAEIVVAALKCARLHAEAGRLGHFLPSGADEAAASRALTRCLEAFESGT